MDGDSCLSAGCTQPDQQERSDLRFHARKIAALLLIRPPYETTPHQQNSHECNHSIVHVFHWRGIYAFFLLRRKLQYL
jgi:hypothetical protein